MFRIKPNKLKLGTEHLVIAHSMMAEENWIPKDFQEDFPISRKQLKYLFFIYKNGTDDDIRDALSDKYYLSEIKVNIQERKRKKN